MRRASAAEAEVARRRRRFPRPKCQAQTRLTMVRAVSGCSGSVIQVASSSRPLDCGWNRRRFGPSLQHREITARYGRVLLVGVIAPDEDRKIPRFRFLDHDSGLDRPRLRRGRRVSSASARRSGLEPPPDSGRRLRDRCEARRSEPIKASRSRSCAGSGSRFAASPSADADVDPRCRARACRRPASGRRPPRGSADSRRRRSTGRTASPRA